MLADCKQHHDRRASYLLVSVISVLLIAAVSVKGQHPKLASVNHAGTGSGNARSGDFQTQAVSGDGRYVLFYSEASDIVPLGAPRASDIFVRDTQTGTTKMASINTAGTASSGVSRFGLISFSGRYVAFTSFVNNIVSNDTNSSPDVFLRDLQTNTTRLVSVNAAGTASAALGESELLAMTPDGRFILFQSRAQDLTAHPDGNGFGRDIYLRDMVNNTTILISVNAAATATGNSTSIEASVSADGRYVAFTSDASDLVANDSNTRDVFLRDTHAGTTTRVSTNPAGTAGGNGESSRGLVAPDGRFVVFATRATSLSTLPDVNTLADIFLYDIQTRTNRLISTNTAGTATGSGSVPQSSDHGVTFGISDNGRFVAFSSQSSDLVPNDTNGTGEDIFRYDAVSQTKTLVSVNLAGNSGTLTEFGSVNPSLSADGRFVAFNSFVNNLVTTADETNGFTSDVFVRDVVEGKTYLASINSAGTRTGNGMSFQPVVSADGPRLVFFSRASDLITNDLNGFNEDVFYFDIPGSAKPVLLTEDNGQRAIALASVNQRRDPFSLTDLHNFSADRRTRVSLFVWRLPLQPGDGPSNIVVLSEDGQGTVRTLEVEHVGAVPNVDSVSQLIVKLPESAAVGDMWLTISLSGQTTNKAFITITP